MDRNAIEEGLLSCRETMPRVWWNLYQGALSAGFNESQSFVLLQSWVMGNAAGALRPPGEIGPETDIP